MAASGKSQRSPLARLLRIVLLALLIAFAVGFTIGSLIRRELERPVGYYAAASGATTGDARRADDSPERRVRARALESDRTRVTRTP